MSWKKFYQQNFHLFSNDKKPLYWSWPCKCMLKGQTTREVDDPMLVASFWSKNLTVLVPCQETFSPFLLFRSCNGHTSTTTAQLFTIHEKATRSTWCKKSLEDDWKVIHFEDYKETQTDLSCCWNVFCFCFFKAPCAFPFSSHSVMFVKSIIIIIMPS